MIFLAHAHEDKPQVRKLYADLQARGLDPWLDEKDLVGGQIWKVEIPKAIRRADVFLACLSKRSVGKRGFVQQELREALSAYGERPADSVYIIPVRFDDCAVPHLQTPDHGLSLQDIHWVDLWQDGGFDRLVSAIEHALGVVASPTGARDEARAAIIPIGNLTEHQPAQEAPKEAGSLPTPGTAFRDIDEPWCPELVVIPPGEFMMGSTEAERQWAVEHGADPEWLENEKPRHLVKIGYSLAVGRFPVTFEEYDRFADATKRERPVDNDWGRGRRPVLYMSWHDAAAYCGWLTRETSQEYRLLTEAEWEYACRAGTATRFWWGDEITPENANYGRNVGKTSEVGNYPENPFGLYDMHGNVWEWVEDHWSASYIGAPDDGSAVPTEGDGDTRRAMRGGSWFVPPGDLRSALRSANWDVVQDGNFGFRIARTLSPSRKAARPSLPTHTPIVVRSPLRSR
jgi:formylglycine-generating enzyme required for sulfatase activity